MTITEVKQALGSWSLRLREDTPRELLDALEYFGHIVISPGKADPRQYGDNLLTTARYVGVYRGRDAQDEYTLNGAGMAFWLGDEDGKGDVFETAVTPASASFASAITSLLPVSGAVTAGTIHSVSGTYTGRHQWESPRSAITYVCDIFSTATFPVEWRVNGDGTLDAGRIQDLYVTTPTAILVKRDPGRDLSVVGIQGRMALSTDVEDYTTRVVVLAQGDGESIATGDANAVSVPYKDIHGNTIKLTRLVSSAETTANNADAVAQLQLNRFTNARSAIRLDSDQFDIKGDFVVGDYIMVFDPDNGFSDSANEVYWRGQPINPIYLRCVEMTWPVPQNWLVAFRDNDGNWFDLSDYYIPESGQTTIGVGDFSRTLTGIGTQPIGTRPTADSSIPATPVFGTFSTAAYQSNTYNDARASVRVVWTEPLNTDGSVILDGDHYEIRYRLTNTFSYPITWNAWETLTWNQAASGTWDRPLSNSLVTASEWRVLTVGFDQEQFTVHDLTVGAEYEFQIRAVDNANPPNRSAWSSSTFITTSSDVIAPSTPAAPIVASSVIGIIVKHELGKATGGTFNLESDLDHLEVHVGGSSSFFADSGTLIGRITANKGMMRASIEAVANFKIQNTSDVWVKVKAVDNFGNKSAASAAVQSSATLIDSAYISELTASKISAGTLSANVVLGASIQTASSGQRVELNQNGVQLYDSNGDLTVNLTADDANPNFIAINDGLENTVASIDSDGNVSGQTITAATDVIIAGESFTDDLYSPLPKGIVARGFSDDNLTVAAGAISGYIELAFTAEAGRIYQVGITGQHDVSVSATGARQLWDVRDGGADVPTTASPAIASTWLLENGTANFNSGGVLIATQEFTSGLHRLLWTLTGGSVAGNYSIRGVDDRSYIWVEDKGDATLVPNTAVPNDGGGVDSGVVTNYTTTYNGSWYQTYKGDGTQKTDTTANQGQYSSSDGNQRSLIGFDYAKIQNDLNGATITACSVTLYAEHWYLNAGGTAVIGTHDYTAKPSTWTDSRVNQNRVQSSGWPKPGKRTVSLGTTIGTEFKTGVSKGIALGPGPTTSTTYYGKFSGTTASTVGNRPTLTITYTK